MPSTRPSAFAVADHRSDYFTYQGDHLREVAFPLGGIGTGCISLEGRGSLIDWEIFNRPNKGSFLGMTFPILWCREQGQPAQTRVIHGPPQRDFTGVNSPNYNQYSFGSGLNREQGNGLPCFAAARFRGTFPFANIAFEHPASPLDVSLRAFSPFIPHDADDSSMPVACLTYRLVNRTTAPVDASVGFVMLNPVGWGHKKHDYQSTNLFVKSEHCHGLEFTNPGYAPNTLAHGSVSLTTDWPNVTSRPYLLRHADAAGFNQMHHFWDMFSADGRLTLDGNYDSPGACTHGAIALHVTLQPGESVELPILISWCFPNYGKAWAAGRDVPLEQETVWTNHYAKRWPTSRHAADDFFARRADLTRRTQAFEQAIFDSSLPPEVIESVSATASILHSPTCIRLPDGTLWGWEGVWSSAGSCPGSCTHVWNYALTQAYLFPDLHRSMRKSEYGSFDATDEGKKGAVVFRVPLPLGSTALLSESIHHAAADGQLGGVVQLYRDWRLSGDEDYLRSMWPSAKRALEYAWHQWDRDKDGLIDGDQHNTYDINFQGPNPLIQFFYLGALLAGQKIAAHLGDQSSARKYQRLYRAGQKLTQERLFNGEYFIQTDDCVKPDAPKFQHGIGCLSDQVFGQLAAHVAGLGYLLDPALVRSALGAVYRHNFRAPLGDHANMQRIYAVADESGLLLCSWPRAGRPAFPFPYSDEVWTGIEYQVASHLIYEGMVEEGLNIVRAIRDRHDGKRRNPYNEFECGSHYARAMAAWGVLLALSGFQYDAVDRRLCITPAVLPGQTEPFIRSFFSTASAWGSFTYQRGRLTVHVVEGQLRIDSIKTPAGEFKVGRDKQLIMSGAIESYP